LEYVLAQRAALGTAVDGGRYKLGSYTHPDAEVIAAIVAGLPDSLGGKRMAIRVAELARAGMTPDWMPGVVPRCVPQDVRENQHGTKAVTIVVGTERVWSRGKWRTVEVRACPVTWRPYPEQIEAARRAYHEWWLALEYLRDELPTVGLLREVEVTGSMPKCQPWEQNKP
jgi:thiazole synthase ThiGH ThiG subunit